MNLDGPWQCDFCGIMIDDYRDVDVHHRDGDKSHNDFANLVAGHHYCHVSHHASNRTPEHKARISAKLRVVR